MTQRLLPMCTLAAALILEGPALMADHGDQGEKHQEGSKHSSDHDDHGWQQLNGYEYHLYGGDDRPQGWNHGTKTGWGNCGLPPGLAKKYDCRTYTYQGLPYYYFQEPDGRMVVRRPTIAVHESADIVH
jgi:hypothetical protein